MILIGSISLNVNAQEEQAIKAFQITVSNFETFFETPQKYIYKEIYSESPTKEIVMINVLEKTNISYDISKTQSIITPYTGYITVTYIRSENNKCGNFKTKYTDPRYTTEELALQNDLPTCYKPINTMRTTFYFAYQNNKWVLKRYDENLFWKYLISNQNPSLTQQESIDLNSKWSVFLKSIK